MHIDALWNRADPAESERRFAAAVADARQEGPATHAELLTQLARARGLQKRFDEAHATLDEAEAILAPADAPRVRVRLLLERGRVFNTSGAPDRGRPLFLQAWDLANAIGETDLALDAAHMMAIVETSDGQIEWSLKALAIAEPVDSRWLGPLYNNLGWTYHDAGRFEEALVMFRKGLAWRQSHATPANTIVIARYAVGKALRSLGRADEALAEQRAARAENAAAGLPADSYVEEEIAALEAGR